MKNIPLIFSAALLILSSCSSTKQNDSDAANKTDTIATADTTNQQLTASMTINPVINAADSALLKFTIYNNTAKSLTFCKWHTPFEPPMSKYLDIISDKGIEANYQGAMAKRVMPPPADSYVEVKAGDSLSTIVDLRKSYLLDQPGRYSIKYNSEAMSGLSVKDSVSFELKK